MTRPGFTLVVLGLAVVAAGAPAFAGGAATPLGPTAYLSAADSPFALGTGTFCLGLQQTGQKLTQLSHRLRSNASRKKIPAEVREPLAAEADRIRDDTKRLRGALACGGG